MNEIKVAENKTLKLTNVLSREVRGDEMANMPLVLTQMHNFIKSNGAQPIGPLVQTITVTPEHEMKMFLMQQATQFIPQMEPVRVWSFSKAWICSLELASWLWFMGPV